MAGEVHPYHCVFCGKNLTEAGLGILECKDCGVGFIATSNEKDGMSAISWPTPQEPPSFWEGLKDAKEGRVVSMEKALNAPPPVQGHEGYKCHECFLFGYECQQETEPNDRACGAFQKKLRSEGG